MMVGKILQLGRRQLHTIISRDMVKPSSPTPPHLHTYNLSEIDQHYLHVYMPLILYYPNNKNDSLTSQEKAQKMKKSLSQSLTRYYPFGGSLHTPEAPYIDCNDEGVVFVEARNDNQLNMSQHISQDDETAAQLFVDGMFWQKCSNRASLVGVQLNHFACGGMAIAVSMSHRIGDARTLGSFLNYWSSVARYGSIDHKEVLPLNPYFLQSPSITNFAPYKLLELNPKCGNRVTKKFMFPNFKLSELKNKVGGTLSINNPTRVEVLTSLLYKTSRSSVLLIPFDLRKTLVPKVHQTTVGNLVTSMLVTTGHESHDSETSLGMVVSEIKRQKMEFERFQSQQLARENFERIMARLGNDDSGFFSNRLWCSSLCGFGYNNVNFGWGKPAVASTTYRSSSNVTGAVLIDTPNGDGIDAWVTLETQDMERFQNDKELLSFCQV